MHYMYIVCVHLYTHNVVPQTYTPLDHNVIVFHSCKQVVSNGGRAGPRGVTVRLLDKERLVQETITTDEGR